MSVRSSARRWLRWGTVPLAVAALAIACLQPSTQIQAGAEGDASKDAEVLTRGPVHEAFGQPTVFNPKPGLLIPKKPPEAVEELPPEEKPQGDNVAWIGGYWSWDEDKTDFLWVSGFWRVLPPGRQWMPGYWNDKTGQYQWVSGYWATEQDDEADIIEEAPPTSLEQGAPPTAPSEEHIWVPGSWVYRTSRYMWRPGYWIMAQPGWVWTPACYYWTPSGYVYIDGYWDWSLRRRGVLFAPCYFNRAVVYRPGYYYRPSIVLDIDVITPHFFCRPVYGHYYFGDYYASSYLSVGITPWFSFTYARGGYYSPDYAYYACHYRRADPQWAINIRLGYERCRDNIAYRPPRTYVQQTTIINNITVNNVKNTTINNKTINNNPQTLALAKPLREVSVASAKNAEAPVKFERISENRAKDFGRTAAEVRQVGKQRFTLENTRGPGTAAPGAAAPGKSVASPNTVGQVKRVTMPKSPIKSSLPINNGTAAGAGSEPGKSANVGAIGNRPANLPPPVPGTEVRRPTRGASAGTPGTIGNPGATNAGNSKTDLGGIRRMEPGKTTLPGAGNTGTGSTNPGTVPGKIDRVNPGSTTPGKMDRLPGGVINPDKGTTLPGKLDRTPPVVERKSVQPGKIESSKSVLPPRGSGSPPPGKSGGSSRERDKGKDKPDRPR